jgi:hypothetical protein
MTTHDRDHAMAVIMKTASSRQYPLYHFTVSFKRQWDHTRLLWIDLPGSSNDFHDVLQSAEGLRNGGVVILEDGVPFLRDDQGDLSARNRFRSMISADGNHAGLVLIFLEAPESEAYLPSICRDRFVRMTIPHPRAFDLEAIAREEVAKCVHREALSIGPEQIHTAAAKMGAELVGLTRSAARDAVRDAVAPAPSDFAGAQQRLRRGKRDLLSRDLGMRVLDTDNVELPVGVPGLLEFLERLKPRMMISGPKRARGVLLIGPPGTGKTMLARSVGRLVGLPVVEFRIGALINSLLGETEGRFNRAFASLEAMAPNIVFIDEIEKAFGDSSERDGGTMMRCTGSLLSWLSDNQNPNFIIATSNSLRRMGEIGLTMTRSERFDAAFFLDVPSEKARREMLLRWLEAHLPECGGMVDELAHATAKFSGADIFSAVKLAATHAGPRAEALRREIDRKRRRSDALYQEFDELRRWGRMYCEPADPDVE